MRVDTPFYNELLALVNSASSEKSINLRSKLALRRKALAESVAPDELTIGSALGPWRIQQAGDAFRWALTDAPSINDRGAWDLKRASIEPKEDGVTRVILIGESAAGSFGYWGEYSLAREIQALFDKDEKAIDVVDLSCVNASMEYCVNVLRHAITLEPDVVIFYCGNNEGKALLDQFDTGTLRGIHDPADRWTYASGDLDAFGPLMISTLADHCAAQLRRACRIAREYGIELIYVLPESNVADWAPQERVPFSLRSEQLSAWLDNYERGVGERDAARLTRLPGECQISSWSEGQIYLERGEIGKAKERLSRAREIGCGAFISAIPQTLSITADRLRRVCAEEDVRLVDMPAVLATGDAAIAGKQHFIDYCHLSEDGIRRVALACAKTIAAATGDDPDTLSWSGCKIIDAKEAFFGALIGAIHNYHYGQPLPMVSHWIGVARASGWARADTFLETLASLLLGRAREHLTPRKLKEIGLLSDVEDRYSLYFLKFVYHARFDVKFVRLIEQHLGGGLLKKILANRVDDLTLFRGDLYSLFYLDCLSGLRPLSRGSNRSGWERADLQFIAEQPRFYVEIAPTALNYRKIDLRLDAPPRCSSEVVCRFNDVELGRGSILPGENTLSFTIPDDARVQLDTDVQSLSFESRAMVGLGDMRGVAERQMFVQRYGWYPTWARVTALSLGK